MFNHEIRMKYWDIINMPIEVEFISKDFVFDEDRSVKWNREQVEKHNTKRQERKKEEIERYKRLMVELNSDILEIVNKELPIKISKETFDELLSRIGWWENDSLNKLEELCKLIGIAYNGKAINSNGTNAKIRGRILPDTKMREIGFTDHDPKTWYFCKNIGSDISLNISIPKDGGDIRIDVLDDNFCQPYDYQYLLYKNPKNKFALKCQAEVEKWMEYLQDKGVLSGHVRGEYI